MYTIRTTIVLLPALELSLRSNGETRGLFETSCKIKFNDQLIVTEFSNNV